MTNESERVITQARHDAVGADAKFERGFQRSLRATALGLLAAIAVIALVDPPMPIAGFFFHTQDIWLLAGQGVALLLVLIVPLSARIDAIGPLSKRPVVFSRTLAVLLLVIAVLGCAFVFCQFDLVRDELDANFDATIFRSGHLLAPLTPEWRPFLGGMRQAFVLPTPGNAFWASNYLPINAAWRAATGATIGSIWANPLLLAAAALALAGVARQIFPGRPSAVVVAAICLVTSSQALVNAMTSYAMTGHLALNLIWLWLFLRNTRSSHALALMVGFLACGLHQLVFHPLFVGPFILSLWFGGRYRLFAIYVAVYAAICLFWTNYPVWALIFEGAPKSQSSAVGTLYFATRVFELVAQFDWTALPLMFANLLRFLAWENPIALVLVALSFEAIRRGAGVARPLAAGIALTIVLCALVLPQQGNGFGYRYLHGLIGSYCLLAAYGWESSMARASARQRGSTRAVFTTISIATIFMFVPWTVVATKRFEAPYRAAVAEIQSLKADAVIVDRLDLVNGGGLVRNDPFLRNRPVILDLLFVDDADLKALCGHAKVVVFPAGARPGAGDPVLAGRRALARDPRAASGLAAIAGMQRRRASLIGCDPPPVQPFNGFMIAICVAT